jgi:hypothetical protein
MDGFTQPKRHGNENENTHNHTYPGSVSVVRNEGFKVRGAPCSLSGGQLLLSKDAMVSRWEPSGYCGVADYVPQHYK